jgi:transposase
VQAHMGLTRGRDQLVRSRTKLINHVRGSVKALGSPIGRCSTGSFPGRARDQIPVKLCLCMEPRLETIGDLSTRIRGMDRQIQQAIDAHYPEAARLQQIRGAGPVRALAFVLLVEDPNRFTKSREVGAYFGLVPELDERSDSQPQLRITKSGAGSWSAQRGTSWGRLVPRAICGRTEL